MAVIKELVINDKTYAFNFGIGFLKEIDATSTAVIDQLGNSAKNGFHQAVLGLIDGNPEDLVRVLMAANKGRVPRIQEAELIGYLDEIDTEALCGEVMDFLSEPGPCKKMFEASKAQGERVKEMQAKALEKLTEQMA